MRTHELKLRLASFAIKIARLGLKWHKFWNDRIAQSCLNSAVKERQRFQERRP